MAQNLVDILLSWRHPGFSLFQGKPVPADDHEMPESLARYCGHPPIALDRLNYDPQTRQVVYEGKNHLATASLDSLPRQPTRLCISSPICAPTSPTLAST